MERWKKIPGYNGRYSVSTLGNVRNNDTQRLRKPSIVSDKNGSKYKKINLSNNGKTNTIMLARLVFLTFRVEFPFGKSVVKFLDKDPMNCELKNLYAAKASRSLRQFKSKDERNKERRRKYRQKAKLKKKELQCRSN